jgi:hypothetical protein
MNGADKQQDCHVPSTLLCEGGGSFVAPGDYRVVTDEEFILSFPAYRRISTMIFIPAQHSSSTTEMLTIEPLDLQAAQARDAAMAADGASVTGS